MQVEYALDPGIASSEFPFSNIQGDANVLIFPSLESANVAYKLMERIGGAECVGPIVLGMNKPVNVLPRGSTSKPFTIWPPIPASRPRTSSAFTFSAGCLLLPGQRRMHPERFR